MIESIKRRITSLVRSIMDDLLFVLIMHIYVTSIKGHQKKIRCFHRDKAVDKRWGLGGLRKNFVDDNKKFLTG
jgi:hypothetical protein